VGKIADEIAKIQIREKLTLPQVFEKYPHLSNLQYEEMKEESALTEDNNRQRELLLD
tara:strand:- start:278 stop:448 length:171 start_codon:yes stop_codon:yes gene_type:complete